MQDTQTTTTPQAEAQDPRRAHLPLRKALHDEAIRKLVDPIHELARYDDLLTRSMGVGYNEDYADWIRRRSSREDYTWLPEIRFVPLSEIERLEGAFDSAKRVVFLDEELIESPRIALETYIQYVGESLAAGMIQSNGRPEHEIRSIRTAAGARFRRLLAQGGGAFLGVENVRVLVQKPGDLSKAGSEVAA